MQVTCVFQFPYGFASSKLQLSAAVHRQKCIEGHRTSKSHRGRIQKQPHMRSLITAQQVFRFSKILRFALIRYHDCISRQFADALHEIVRFNDVLRRFHSVWLKIQREITVMVEAMFFEDVARLCILAYPMLECKSIRRLN